MVYSFKWRNGVKTCDPCGRDEHYASAVSNQKSDGRLTKDRCSSAECPWKYPDSTSEEMLARVAELEAKYSMWRL